ncbi:unnamed protein product [Protopolystoma xenopodis]|uniref:Uncharacterized protein n=1 Tax=Protopolystoma xenopodis TaxID=117903 RepID=A0A3S5A5J3_9PLAT|nr:unnamed protein product [Protopolystoma xenopodis]
MSPWFSDFNKSLPTFPCYSRRYALYSAASLSGTYSPASLTRPSALILKPIEKLT